MLPPHVCSVHHMQRPKRSNAIMIRQSLFNTSTWCRLSHFLSAPWHMYFLGIENSVKLDKTEKPGLNGCHHLIIALVTFLVYHVLFCDKNKTLSAKQTLAAWWFTWEWFEFSVRWKSCARHVARMGLGVFLCTRTTRLKSIPLHRKDVWLFGRAGQNC